jgi:xanthine dehydrogenase accessory factor
VNLLKALESFQHESVLVTVAATRGSTPREAGTHMLVAAHGIVGTIGGGELERRAIETARELLTKHEPGYFEWSGRVTLGAQLGQCCGGETTLLYEVLGVNASGWRPLLDALVSLNADAAAIVVTPVDAPMQRWFVTSSGVVGSPLADEAGDAATSHAQALLADGDATSGLVQMSPESENSMVLFDVLGARGSQIVLFGAGHVGHALLAVLGTLPYGVTVIDDRADRLPAGFPDNVDVRFSRAPELEVAHVPPGSLCLVMTYSHALDRKICGALLARDDLPYVGLIGSASKRRSFENYWRKNDMETSRMARLVCPIGLDGIGGKEPGMIAVAVAAQLINLIEAEDKVHG